MPLFLYSQDTKKDSTNINRPDGYSGATNTKKEAPKFKGNISGRIKSSSEKEALEFATVSLSNSKTNSIIEGTITDVRGKFYFQDIPVGEYNIKIKFIVKNSLT